MAVVYTIEEISRIIGGELLGNGPAEEEHVIEHLLTDSRKLVHPASTLFFAIPGPRRSGEAYIEELYERGVRYFVVPDSFGSRLPDTVFISVKDPLTALQQLAAFHRQQFSMPVIAIAGSNGKTIVKEWLYQLLEKDYRIVRSPKSYNSQVGVPLSVWLMNDTHNLAIFEAGISRKDEMQKLEQVIRPTIGVFTHLGDAHGENFTDPEEKAAEKFKLFTGVDWVVANGDDKIVRDTLLKAALPVFSYGATGNNAVRVLSVLKKTDHTVVNLQCMDDTIPAAGEPFELMLPFTDDASVENGITCACVLLRLGYAPSVLAERIEQLRAVSMRLEMKKGINNCMLINDSYVADPDSFRIALDFMQQVQQYHHRTVILSDLMQTGKDPDRLYAEIADLLQQKGVQRIIGVGPQISQYTHLLERVCEEAIFFTGTEALLQQFHQLRFQHELILIKGARAFAFERISALLEQKTHQTVLEINLSAIAHNIRQLQRLLRPGTKMMAMVKAFSYGGGSFEIANVLQYSKVDYLAVAYADEGVELRKAGIRLPIMVMNPEESGFAAMTEHSLEPEVYSFNLLYRLRTFLQREGMQYYPVHIKVDTGMHRLGFAPGEIADLAHLLSTDNMFSVQSVFSHLAGSEDPGLDYFTQQQAETFIKACDVLQQRLDYPFLKHIANSAAIMRHPDLQYDMVRPGITMYGLPDLNHLGLKEAVTLKTTIAQIKNVPAGDAVGYNRLGQVQKESVIATIRIGYADGYRRAFGNGIGHVLIKGYTAPVVGNVAMDMTMVDITGIPDVRENDEVIVFGEQLSVAQLAAWANTIPYEIMTGISQRVQRVYYEE